MNTGTLEKDAAVATTATTMQTKMPHVVIIGAGFAGLRAAKALRHAPVKVTVIDRRNHHLFQPQLYQVAVASLSPTDIAEPIRGTLRKQHNTEVVLAEVTGIDPEGQCVYMDERALAYDYLVIATGAQYNYFGHDEWRQYAHSLKTIEDATRLRQSILLAFEQAAAETNEQKRRALLTFVVIGAGPAGVEMISQLSDMIRTLLKTDYKQLDPKLARVLLVEAGPRILAPFSESLAKKAHKALERHGVEVKTRAAVESIDAEGVVIAGEHLAARTVIWLAGVKASSPVSRWLALPGDNAGRVTVGPDLSIEGHPNVFVIGDTARIEQQGQLVPGLAPAAMQAGAYVAQLIAARAVGKPHTQPFHYHSEGKIATVGRYNGVADMGRFKFSGLLAWMTWMAVHSLFLFGFRKRALLLIQWTLAYMSLQRNVRLILPDQSDHTHK